MHLHRLVKVWWLALIFTLCTISSACAFPPLPSSFYGTVQQDGENIPDGSLVEALIEGKVVAYSLSETFQGTSVFSLDVPGDDSATEIVEGGTPGQEIEFRVGGVLADQVAQWTSGVNENIDLTLPAGIVVSPTMQTITPVPSQTPIPNATRTSTIPQRTGNNSGHEDPTIEINLTETPILLSTHGENSAKQEEQSGYGSNAALVENGDLSDASPKSTIAVASSNDERETAPDPMTLVGDTNQRESVKNNTALWIGLSLFLLICGLACVFIVRRRYPNP